MTAANNTRNGSDDLVDTYQFADTVVVALQAGRRGVGRYGIAGIGGQIVEITRPREVLALCTLVAIDPLRRFATGLGSANFFNGFIDLLEGITITRRQALNTGVTLRRQGQCKRLGRRGANTHI